MDVEEKYREYVGQSPPRWGHGPWWVSLVINVFPKAGCRTQIWCSSAPDLQVEVANQIHYGFARWVPAMEIGPFESEEEALGFFKLWGQTASKDRLSQVLWGLTLFNKYRQDYGLELRPGRASDLVPDDGALKAFADAQAETKKTKRGRGGDVFSRRYRIWEMTPPPVKRVTCGEASARRVIREKRKKEARRRKLQIIT